MGRVFTGLIFALLAALPAFGATRFVNHCGKILRGLNGKHIEFRQTQLSPTDPIYGTLFFINFTVPRRLEDLQITYHHTDVIVAGLMPHDGLIFQQLEDEAITQLILKTQIENYFLIPIPAGGLPLHLPFEMAVSAITNGVVCPSYRVKAQLRFGHIHRSTK